MGIASASGSGHNELAVGPLPSRGPHTGMMPWRISQQANSGAL